MLINDNIPIILRNDNIKGNIMKIKYINDSKFSNEYHITETINNEQIEIPHSYCRLSNEV